MGWFTGKPKPKPKPPFGGKSKAGTLQSYVRTYGPKDGRTVFEASQIKAKRRKKR